MKSDHMRNVAENHIQQNIGTRNNRDNWIYIAIQAFYWMAYCTVCGYVSSYLRSIGYEDSRIGIVIAATGIASSVLQPLLAGAIDRSGRRLLKPVLTVCLLLSVFLSLPLFFESSIGMIPAGILFACIMACLQLTQPLVNTLNVSARSEIRFSTARAAGSVAYALISFTIGQLLTVFGMETLSLVRIIMDLILLLLILGFPIQTGTELLSIAEKGSRHSDNSFFRRNIGFGWVMIGCLLIYFCHVLTSYYNYQIILSKGGDNSALGIVLFLAAVSELPVMFGFSKLLRLRTAGLWLTISGIGFAVKAAAYLAAPDMIWFYGAQITQLLGWAMNSVSSVEYVKRYVAGEDSTRGQAFITLTYTAAMVLGSVSGGFLLQYAGVGIMLLTAIASALVGTVFLILGVKSCLKTKEGI